ncbi:MAG: hypothetical protein CMD39_07390 [Gammaproteobacteria bacterium]|nr:hypothetical protein [Gammaproteobacteria bacterium]
MADSTRCRSCGAPWTLVDGDDGEKLPAPLCAYCGTLHDSIPERIQVPGTDTTVPTQAAAGLALGLAGILANTPDVARLGARIMAPYVAELARDFASKGPVVDAGEPTDATQAHPTDEADRPDPEVPS